MEKKVITGYNLPFLQQAARRAGTSLAEYLVLFKEVPMKRTYEENLLLLEKLIYQLEEATRRYRFLRKHAQRNYKQPKEMRRAIKKLVKNFIEYQEEIEEHESRIPEVHS